MLVAAGFFLAAFLGAAGVALDQAFRDSALTSVRERLTVRVYMILGMVDFDTVSTTPVASVPADPVLSTPESGHYAQLLDSSGERVWNSRSMLGITFNGPTDRIVGRFSFDKAVSSAGEALFTLSYTVLWEGEGSEGVAYTVQVAENERGFLEQVGRFRKSLWLGFLAIGAILLLLQTLVLRWGLKPLRDVAAEVNLIERGDKDRLGGDYPSELKSLTENLNALIRTNESSVKRYRNALGDLAHSLKTPLAVIRAHIDRGADSDAESHVVGDSLDQLDSTIEYQLQRAAAAGRSSISGAFEIAPIIEKIANSLRKVHASRNILIQTTVIPEARFHGDRGDLMEVVGNLADNACKWARSRVAIDVTRGANDRLVIKVTDDGKGIPRDDIERTTVRGARLDQSTAGHGIGLAVVKELVEEIYRGELAIESSPAGTVVTVIFDGN